MIGRCGHLLFPIYFLTLGSNLASVLEVDFFLEGGIKRAVPNSRLYSYISLVKIVSVHFQFAQVCDWSHEGEVIFKLPTKQVLILMQDK